jgi:hypothetical protein
VLAQLRPRQKVKASALRDGTTAGAAAIAMIDEGRLPTIGLQLTDIAPAVVPHLEAYHQAWKARAYTAAA